MKPLTKMGKHYQNRFMAARAWKKNGGKVVGYISDAVPVELIIAAGLFPLRLCGESGPTDKADDTMEFFFDPMVRSIYNQILTGELDFLDFLVIPHYNDSIFKLYYYLLEIKRKDPFASIPEFYLFDMLYTKWFGTDQYNYQRVLELKSRLEKISGKEISQDDLSEAISIVNENRSLLRKVSRLRKAESLRISGVEALQIIGASMFMNKKEHSRVLNEFLSEANSLPQKNGIRVSIEGSQIDHLKLYELIESCGATIVTESHSWGDRYSEHTVDTTVEPLWAITERYHLYSSSPRLYPKDIEMKRCLLNALKFNTRGVIFFLLKWDDVPAWEYPEQKKILDNNNIPSICFREQQYDLGDTDKIIADTKEFISRIQ